MQVEKHISELLFEYDCVIVSDFGGFVCNYSPAGIHPSKHRFHPPFKKISFNRNLKNNDGLLANHVSQSACVSYPEANRLIGEYVHALNAELNSARRFELNNIGTFYIGEENTLHFSQDETVNYLPDSFGLSSFNSPLIRRESIERKAEKKLKDKVIVPSKERTEGVPAKKRVSRTLLASAAVVLIAVLLWIPFQSDLVKNIDYSSLNPFAAKGLPLYQASEFSQPDPDKDDIKPDVSNLIAMAGKDTLRYLNIVIDGHIPIVVQLKDEFTPAPKAKKRAVRSSNNFHIVGGAFAISENAEKLLKKLVKAGYDASIIDSKGKNNLRFVSYGGFATKEEALQALEKIRAVQQDVWLMTN